MKMSTRIEYIDALRGFVMLLVVLAHVPMYCYHQTEEKSFSLIPTTFHLALFFFISGWFYKIDSGISGSILRPKFIQLIVPTMVFYILYCRLQGVNIMDNLWNDKFKAGYWFCIVLFCFNLLMIALGRLKGFGGIFFCVAMSLCAVMLNTNAVTRLLTEQNIPNILCVQQWQYFIFFYIGYLAHRYQEFFFAWLDNGRIMAISILLFFGSLLVYYKQPIDLLGIKVTFFFWGGLGSILSFAFFRKFEDSFSRQTYVGQTLQYIGRRTLDVYLLHFFFLPRFLMPYAGQIKAYDSQFVEFVVILAVSLVVLIVSLGVSYLIRLSPFLAHYLFGIKTTSTHANCNAKDDATSCEK